jgi:hypothetical protein
MNGVHENMLNLPYMDHSMEQTVAMCEWLEHFDVWNHRCMSKAQFELMPLLPTAVLGAATLCCSVFCFLCPLLPFSNSEVDKNKNVWHVLLELL